MPLRAARTRRTGLARRIRRGLACTGLLLIGGGIGLLAGSRPEPTSAQALARPTALGQLDSLRVHGYPVVSNPARPAHANRPATAGDNTARDPFTGGLPEDPPYTSLDGPYDPFSDQAPEMDLVTWNPAWISERLADPRLRAQWPGLSGVDEVSRGANIRASGVNASQKVWLRHWYEPTHLGLDLNADGRLTDADNDGLADAPANPIATSIDEWYPAIMAELSFMLLENDPLPQANPAPSELYRSAPRPFCGMPGKTQMVFPVGTSLEATHPEGAPIGQGLTSLDADFDGRLDMVQVSDEAQLPALLGGLRIDFDGDGSLDPLDPDGSPLSCDEQVVLHSEALVLRAGQKLQFLDHFVTLGTVSRDSAVLDVWGNAGLRPRKLQSKQVGIGGALLAGEAGPLLGIAPGGSTLGQVPPGPWFAYLVDADPDRGTAIVILGRALGAPCAAMQSSPGRPNLSPGGPWFLKRLYVDGHEYDLTAISTCAGGGLESLTLRTPIPKVDVTIEQHSVRLQGYALSEGAALPWLPLPHRGFDEGHGMPTPAEAAAKAR